MLVSTMVEDWEPLFADSDSHDEVQRILSGFIKGSNVALMAYGIMEHHVHLLVGHPENGGGVSKFVGGFKSLVSRRMFPDRKGIWKPRFDDVIVISDHVFRIKLNYIHDNPVRARYVRESEDWRWSSARFWLREEPHDHLTRSWSWVERKSVA